MGRGISAESQRNRTAIVAELSGIVPELFWNLGLDRFG